MMMRGRFALALGQPAPATMELSLCPLIKPALYVPGVRELVQQIGCKNPAAKAALSAAIIQNYTKTTGDKIEAAPWWSQVLAIAGPEILADCVCQDKAFQPPPGGWPKPKSQGLSLSDPVVLGGLAIAAVAVALVVAKQRAPRAVLQAPPTAVAAAPALHGVPPAPPSPASKPPAPPSKLLAGKPTPSPRASQRRRTRN